MLPDPGELCNSISISPPKKSYLYSTDFSAAIKHSLGSVVHCFFSLSLSELYCQPNNATGHRGFKLRFPILQMCK